MNLFKKNGVPYSYQGYQGDTFKTNLIRNNSKTHTTFGVRFSKWVYALAIILGFATWGCKSEEVRQPLDNQTRLAQPFKTPFELKEHWKTEKMVMVVDTVRGIHSPINNIEDRIAVTGLSNDMTLLDYNAFGEVSAEGVPTSKTMWRGLIGNMPKVELSELKERLNLTDEQVANVVAIFDNFAEGK